jgi:hypothetical protein
MLAPSVPARAADDRDQDDADADPDDTIELLAAGDDLTGEDLVPPDVLDAEEAAWHRVWADEQVPGVGVQRQPLRLTFIRDRADLERRRIHAWAVLREIDAHLAAGKDPSNALVMCALVAPYVLDAIVSPGSRPGDANHAILEIGQPLVDQLRVARRDAERLRQILLALRRIVPARRRRGNLDGLGSRDVVEDGVTLHELLERAGAAPAALPPGEPSGEAAAAEAEADAADDPADAGELDEHGQPRKRRRRRRGGRRRRRDDGTALEGATAS